MKNFILSVSLICLAKLLHAQTCGAGGITFSTQASVDNFTTNFPGCTQIVGNVTIQNPLSITNLNGLSVVTAIGGNLLISNADGLNSLSGLSNLTSIGGNLRIVNSDGLTNLNGLAGVNFLGGDLVINNNDALSSLTGLSGIISVSDLSLNGNTALTDLSGIAGLTSIGGNVTINGNDALVNLTGLSGITSIGGYISIINNEGLINLTGLSGLTTLPSSYIEIRNNNSLLNLSGLSNLNSIGGSVDINNNPALTSLTGISGLTTIGGHLNIVNNNLLVNLSGLSEVVTIGDYLLISSNDALSYIGLTKLNSVGQYLIISSNKSLANLSGLSSLTSVAANLTISTNLVLNDLTALSNLTSIGGGYLSIENNAPLISLSGLDNINPSTISNLFIQSSTLLSICNVKSICEYLAIPSNPAGIVSNAVGCNSREEVETACLMPPLPIELTYFKGERIGNDVYLSWQTANEVNNDFFQIEHSMNGVSFEEIGQVMGKGKGQQLKNYNFIYNNQADGTNYFRLKQVDLNGNLTYSNVIVIENNQNEIKIIPNPSKGQFKIIGLHQLGDVNVKISNGTGIIINEAETYNGIIEISAYTKGLYFVTISNNYSTITKRLFLN